MGFMDKAKKLAEQAQQKLDDAQGQFNKGGSTGGEPQGGGQRFDAHGRPIPQAETPGAAPQAPSTGGAAPAAPAQEQPPGPDAPAPQEPADPPPPPQQSGDTNATPDPFKPLQQ
jgi:hypothetical protein